ncbi:MAG: hypothetical protein IKM76_04475, partial [Prevotella sp.]|nr:hypothetical protein [Prevotella sp.]
GAVAPVGSAETAPRGNGGVEGDTGRRGDLRAEVGAALVGGVEMELEAGEGGEVADEGAAVAAQSGGIAHDALGVVADEEGWCHSM